MTKYNLSKRSYCAYVPVMIGGFLGKVLTGVLGAMLDDCTAGVWGKLVVVENPASPAGDKSDN